MKKVLALIILAFVVIAGVMLYLVKTGVSLRPAPLIKPSPMTDGIQTIARDLSLRLFPDFQDVDYVVWGLNAEDTEALEVLNLLRAEEELRNKTSIQILTVSEKTTRQEVQECKTPCWLLRPQEEAHELKPNSFMNEVLKPLIEESSKKYFTLTVVPFEFGTEVPAECLAERRLDFECIQKVSVQATERKLPKELKAELALIAEGKSGRPIVRGVAPRKRYFFLNKYNHGDFFLYIEKPAKF